MRKTLLALCLLVLAQPVAHAQGSSRINNGAASSGAGAVSQKVAPNQNSVYVSPNCGTQPNCYQVLDDVQFAYHFSCTNTSQTITTSTADPPFTAADVGKYIIGVNAENAAANCPPLGTITGYTNAHSVTVSQAATVTFTQTGGQSVGMAWGHDDGAQLAAAFAASRGAGCLYLPTGAMFFSVPPFLDTRSNPEGPVDCIYGQHGTVLTPLSSFAFASCTSSEACVFEWPEGTNQQPNQAVLRDFTIYDPGWKLTGSGSGLSWLYESRVVSYNVQVWDTGSQIAAGVNFAENDSAYYPAVYMYSTGANGCEVGGTGGTTAGLNQAVYIVGGSGYCAGAADGLIIGGNAGLTSWGLEISGNNTPVSCQGLWNSLGDQIYAPSGTSPSMTAASTHCRAYLQGDYVVASAGSTFGGINCQTSGANIFLKGVTLDGNGGVSIRSLSGCVITDEGDNNYLNPSLSLSGTWLNKNALAGSCAMSTSTSCTASLSTNASSPLCFATDTGSDGIGASCKYSAGTVTVTAASSNSDTWGVLLY